MSELFPEQFEESPEPKPLGEIIGEMVVDEGAFDGSREEDEAARKLQAQIKDVKSEIDSLWEEWEELIKNRASSEAIDNIKTRLLSAQARRIQLEPPKTQ